MSQDNTPTESLVGFDGDGVPSAHTTASATTHAVKPHTHTWRKDTDDYGKPVIYCDYCGTHQKPEHLDADRPMSFSERLRAIHYIEPILPKPDDLAYMAPEAVEEMLRRCNHVCRTNGCGQVVDRCGQFCEDCQGEIDAWNRREPQKPTLFRRLLSLFSRGRGKK